MSSDDSRPILQQANIDLYNDVTYLVATDSYKLVALPVDGVSDIVGHRIEREDIVKWYKLASNKDRFTNDTVRELAKPTYTDFSEKDTEVKLYGKYPQWQSLIPTGEKTALTETALNANFLVTVQNLFDSSGLTLQFYKDKSGPVVVRNNGMIGLIVPIRS